VSDDDEPRVPREPMEGGSDRPELRDDAASAVFSLGSCCDGCECDGFPLLRLSAMLTVAALVLPASAGGPVVGLIRFYRRLLTRFTRPCPSTPSCSAYALAAVQDLGARRGLVAAADRLRACGSRRPAFSPRRSREDGWWTP
jgi:putative component of membrane protein insertase Oxa1/YidC/SpoIIIJ protein YidD